MLSLSPYRQACPADNAQPSPPRYAAGRAQPRTWHRFRSQTTVFTSLDAGTWSEYQPCKASPSRQEDWGGDKKCAKISRQSPFRCARTQTPETPRGAGYEYTIPSQSPSPHPPHGWQRPANAWPVQPRPPEIRARGGRAMGPTPPPSKTVKNRTKNGGKKKERRRAQ